jgi:drug/metabolite transporter (DMT)-like permease
MSAAVVLGLLAALGYGAADFVARYAARGVGVWRTLFYNSVLAGLGFGLWLAVEPERAIVAKGATLGGWAAAGGSGLIVLLATACLFRGLAHGTLAVVAPVTASYGAVTALLSAVAGERLSTLTASGIAVTILGVGLASMPRRAPGASTPAGSGILWALAASLCYGVGLWLQGTFAVPVLGAVPTVCFYYVTNVAALGLSSWLMKRSLEPPPLPLLSKVFAVGVLGACGYAALVLGFATGQVAVVTVLSTLASLVTVLCARLLAAEPVAPHQWVGALAVVGGLALINGAT